MQVHMGKVMKHVCIGLDVDHKLHGHLPKMATTSQCYVDALQASCFPEGVNSVGNQILAKGSTLLGPGESNNIVVLDRANHSTEPHGKRWGVYGLNN